MTKKRHCQGTTKSGEPCRAPASVTGFCFTHDPSKGKQRAIARRNGGLSRITPSVGDKTVVSRESRSIEDVMTILDYALQETLALSNTVQRGRLLIAIAHGYIEALKVGELEERMEAIELAIRIRERKTK